MQGVLLAALAILLELDAIRVVAAVLLGRVIALFAVDAGQVNDHAHVFFRHCRFLAVGEKRREVIFYLAPRCV
jgi:hypothetical protein